MRKKVKNIFLILLLTIMFLPIKTFALSGSYSISSNSSVQVGDTISVTFTIKGSGLFYWQAYITYDTSKLQLSSGSTSFQGESDSIKGQGSVSRTLKFKAKKTGAAWVSIAMGDKGNNINADGKEMSFSKQTKNITVKEKKNVTYSSNNNLKSLSLDGYKISPDFSKDKLEYSVELPNDVKEVTVKATAEDNTASITGTGKQKVSEGTNKLKIVVTAENGNKKEYIINATVKELDPIKVEIGGEEYTVIRKKDELPEVSSVYVVTTTKIEEDEVPALKSEITNYTLVGAKNSKGEKSLFIYDGTTYTPYEEYTFNKLTIIPIDDSSIKIPSGYKKTEITVRDQKITGYKKTGEYPIFIGMNIETGEKHIYSYDAIENTIQIFNKNNKTSTGSNLLNFSDDNMYVYAIAGLGGFLIITYIGILISLVKRNKKQKRISL